MKPVSVLACACDMKILDRSARVLVPKPQLAYECFSELFCALTALGVQYMPGPGTWLGLGLGLGLGLLTPSE